MDNLLALYDYDYKIDFKVENQYEYEYKCADIKLFRSKRPIV